MIDGIICDAPKINRPVWDNSISEAYRNEYGRNVFDYLKLLFDEEEEACSFRSWYFIETVQYVTENFVLPLKSWCDEHNKKFFADIGIFSSSYQLLANNITLECYYKNGCAVSFNSAKACDCEGISAAWTIGRNVFLAEIFDIEKQRCFNFENVSSSTKICGGKMENQPDILLILPVRGVMERFVFTNEKHRCKTESNAAVASGEGMYYAEMLFEKGCAFGATDEIALEKYALVKNGRFTLLGQEYSHILIPECCAFSQDGINILENAAKCGVCINSSELIDALNSELLD